MRRADRLLLAAALALVGPSCGAPADAPADDLADGVGTEDIAVAPYPSDAAGSDAAAALPPGRNGERDDAPTLIEGPPSSDAAAPCPVLGEPAPAALCEYYTSQWEALDEGRGVIDRPDQMQRGETATVTLVLGRPDEEGAPSEEAMESMLGAEADQQFDVRVGRRMAAELRGNGFEIEPEGIVRKDLFLGQGQRWDWDITAIRAPNHRLQVITYAVVDSPEGAKESLLRTETIDVPVSLTWQNWVSDRTQDFTLLEKFLLGLAAVLAAMLAVWVGLRKFRPA